MFLPYGIACAGAILRPWAGEGRSRVAGTTREPFDEPTTQKRPALRVACGRAPASLRRSSDVPASPFAARLADRLARTQRRLFPYERNMLWSRPHRRIVAAAPCGLRLPAALRRERRKRRPRRNASVDLYRAHSRTRRL